jgi:hypothetical protein
MEERKQDSKLHEKINKIMDEQFIKVEKQNEHNRTVSEKV